ncbi:MAG TPA: hypothetical protein VGN20_06830 [Mucilaginibacter sp.]|jgi:hypothetical protein
MFKRLFIHGLIAAAIASIAAVVYNRIYFFATEADFSKSLNIGTMIGLSVLICMTAAFVCYGLLKWLGKKGEIVFNFVFSIVTYAGMIIPISLTLPLDIKFPELFPGLAVPMVFFPAMAWYTLRPLFPVKD